MVEFFIKCPLLGHSLRKVAKLLQYFNNSLFLLLNVHSTLFFTYTSVLTAFTDSYYAETTMVIHVFWFLYDDSHDIFIGRGFLEEFPNFTCRGFWMHQSVHRSVSSGHENLMRGYQETMAVQSQYSYHLHSKDKVKLHGFRFVIYNWFRVVKWLNKAHKSYFCSTKTGVLLRWLWIHARKTT